MVVQWFRFQGLDVDGHEKAIGQSLPGGGGLGVVHQGYALRLAPNVTAGMGNDHIEREQSHCCLLLDMPNSVAR